jgi:transcriptional regulator with XRE-family HTH domain
VSKPAKKAPPVETPPQAVARLLAERGWTVYRLSRESGVGQNVLARWLKGRKGDKTDAPDVTLETARAVFRALGASLALLDPPATS